MTRKELKQLIKEHKIRQVLSIPHPGRREVICGTNIIYQYVNEEKFINVHWFWSSDEYGTVTPKQNIAESNEECLQLMFEDIDKMHADPIQVEAVHRLYNECTDIMNSSSNTMEDKLCAKYVRKACDFFIHDRRYHNEIFTTN